jgi:hypothetical protein
MNNKLINEGAHTYGIVGLGISVTGKGLTIVSMTTGMKKCTDR